MRAADQSLKAWLVYGQAHLAQQAYGNVPLELRMMLKKILGVDDLYLLTHGNDLLSETAARTFQAWIEKRNTGYPIQYILGEQEFMGLRFEINDKVLVPRGDTEILIEAILNELKAWSSEKIEVLDIGTGSGAIPVSLAYYDRRIEAQSVDVNREALLVAENNAKNLGVADRVKVYESDLFQQVKGCYDVIVSNPPYIESEVIEALQTEVRYYEPRLALDGGADGLDFYREIVEASPRYLKNQGLLAFEIGHDQGPSLKALMAEQFADIQIIQDLAGKDRVVMGRLRG